MQLTYVRLYLILFQFQISGQQAEHFAWTHFPTCLVKLDEWFIKWRLTLLLMNNNLLAAAVKSTTRGATLLSKKTGEKNRKKEYHTGGKEVVW